MKQDIQCLPVSAAFFFLGFLGFRFLDAPVARGFMSKPKTCETGGCTGAGSETVPVARGESGEALKVLIFKSKGVVADKPEESVAWEGDGG
jgi:hypothetical protein